MAGSIADTDTRSHAPTVNPTTLTAARGRSGASAAILVASEDDAAIDVSDARTAAISADFDNPTEWIDAAVPEVAVLPFELSTFDPTPGPPQAADRLLLEVAFL